MGSRYLVSGAQLGCLRAFSSLGELEKVNELVDKIIEEQHIGVSFSDVKEDAEKIHDVCAPIFSREET